jgi:hypothetical protein
VISARIDTAISAGVAADVQPDGRAQDIKLFGEISIFSMRSPAAGGTAFGTHGSDVERVGREGLHQSHVIDARIVGERENGSIAKLRCALITSSGIP